MTEDDKSYYLERAETQLELAQSSTHPDAVRAHYTLAGLYLDRVYGSSNVEREPNEGLEQAH